MPVEPEYCKTDVHGNELTEAEREWCEENDYTPDPFTKFNWKTAASRDSWRDLMQEAATAADNAEWQSVLSDRTDRKAAIIHVNNLNREKWLRRVGEHGLAYRDIRHTAPYNGFSHEFISIEDDDPERLTYAVIAENPDVADKMEEAETEMSGPERHDVVGELLNFPKCCREFFNEIWLEDRRIDPMYEISCNTESATAIDGDRQNVLVEDPLAATNVMYRYWGHSFLTHMPCSWDCERSQDVARARYEIMAENGHEEAANALFEWLELPMVWTGTNGIAHVRNRHMLGATGTSTYWDKKRIVWKRKHQPGGSII